MGDHFEAVYGEVEEPGLLQAKRCVAPQQPEKGGFVFYSAKDGTGGQVHAGDRFVVFTRSDGRKETWRIIEWGFDPFLSNGLSEEVPAAAQDDRVSTSPTHARSHSSGKNSMAAAPAPLCIKSPPSLPELKADAVAEAEADEEDVAIASPTASMAGSAEKDSATEPAAAPVKVPKLRK